MVNRIGLIVGAVLAIAVGVEPTFAQSDDYPRIESSIGYGNLGLNLSDSTDRHSGFTSQTGFNLTRWFGIENYTGVYGLGDNTTLFSNIFGGKVAARASSRFVPYAVAGIGIGYFTQSSSLGYSQGSLTNARLGGGVDIGISDGMAIRVDVSRMSFKSGGWFSGTNVSTGLVFRIN